MLKTVSGSRTDTGTHTTIYSRTDRSANSGGCRDSDCVTALGSSGAVLDKSGPHGDLLPIHEAQVGQLESEFRDALNTSRLLDLRDTPTDHLSTTRHDESIGDQRPRERRGKRVTLVIAIARQKSIYMYGDPRSSRQGYLRRGGRALHWRRRHLALVTWVALWIELPLILTRPILYRARLLRPILGEERGGENQKRNQSGLHMLTIPLGSQNAGEVPKCKTKQVSNLTRFYNAE